MVVTLFQASYCSVVLVLTSSSSVEPSRSLCQNGYPPGHENFPLPALKHLSQLVANKCCQTFINTMLQSLGIDQ